MCFLYAGLNITKIIISQMFLVVFAWSGETDTHAHSETGEDNRRSTSNINDRKNNGTHTTLK